MEIFQRARSSVSRLGAVLAVVSFTLPCAAQDANFEQVNDPKLGAKLPELRAQLLRTREADGGVLEARGDRLTRVRAGTRLDVRCLLKEGPGTIRALAADPAGGTFVAADRGLFSISPEVDVLAPFNYRGEQPPGNPVGVYVDSRRRLWVLTDESLACIELRRLVRRFLTAKDGLPSNPTAMVTTDGSLVILASDGTYSYRPDVASKPTLEILTVNGRPYTPGETLTVTYPDGVTLGLRSVARGGARFLVLRGTHKRYSGSQLNENEVSIRRADPGIHRVPVVAVDQDLNSSEPATITIDSQWPLHYRPSLVVPLGLGGAAIVFATFLFVARRRGGSCARAALSAFLCVVLFPQILAGLIPHVRGWPFVGFGMYANWSEAGDEVQSLFLEGIRADGSRIGLSDMHMLDVFGCLSSAVIVPLMRNPEAAGPQFVETYNRLVPGEGIIGVQLTNYRYLLRPEGPIELAPFARVRYVGENDADRR